MIIVDIEANTPLLQSTREMLPEMTLKLENEQATGGVEDEPIRLHFWAENVDFDTLENALADDPTVKSPAVIADLGERRLYRVLYTDKGMGLTPHSKWVGVDASLLRASNTPTGWEARMRFPDDDAIVEFKAWFQDRDYPFRITGLFREGAKPPSNSAPNLTEKQQEAILTAWRNGYFSVPSETDLEELGSELGISDSAVSQRIRRGLTKLLEYYYDADSTTAPDRLSKR